MLVKSGNFLYFLIFNTRSKFDELDLSGSTGISLSSSCTNFFSVLCDCVPTKLLLFLHTTLKGTPF